VVDVDAGPVEGSTAAGAAAVAVGAADACGGAGAVASGRNSDAVCCLGGGCRSAGRFFGAGFVGDVFARGGCGALVAVATA
jgi:hypothetical protein